MEVDARSRNTSGQRVALIGASGFIGSATLTALRTRDNVDVIGVQLAESDESDVASCDITDLESLRAVLRGVDVVIHAASYIGYDEVECERVNVQGTSNVVAACAGAGVRRLIYVSTAAVYGAGVHRDARESDLIVAPNSVLSATRARAEELVLEAGGIVIRPHFVFGTGDRWLVPGIRKLLNGIKGIPDAGRARHSTIEVLELGDLLAQLAVAPGVSGPTVFHASATDPATLAQIAHSSLSAEDFNALEDLSRDEAYKRAQNAGLSARHIDWLADDHVYNSSAIWEALRLR